MKTFDDLVFNKHPLYENENIGVAHQARLDFPNNYGVSVVKSPSSYGGKDNLWELAVLYCDEITYNTSITDDVIGWLTNEKVTEIMQKVQELDESKSLGA